MLGFAGFFLDDADLVFEIFWRFRVVSFAVISSDVSSGFDQLGNNRSSNGVEGNCLTKLDHIFSEFGSFFL